MSFQDIADQRLLSSVKDALGELEWDVEMDSYLSIEVPAHLEGILTLMIRRGLEPALVMALFNVFRARPLERALLAWDVLNGALLGAEDRELGQQMFKELGPLKQLGATRTAAVPRDRVTALIDAARPGQDVDPVPLLDDFLGTPSLAALVALTSIRKTLADDDPFVEATIAHAKKLALAHLPSLAIGFMQILWDRFHVDSALHLMVELALDHDLLDSLPEMTTDDEHTLARRAYVAVRSRLNTYDVLEATMELAAAEEFAAVKNSADPSLILARAELALLTNKRFDESAIQLINAIAPPDSGWRYAVRIRESMIIATKPHLAAGAVQAFIPKFGNDVRLWRRAGRHAEARTRLLKMLSRELRYVSHEPEVWRAVGFFSKDAGPIKTEIQQRLRTQLGAALGA